MGWRIAHSAGKNVDVVIGRLATDSGQQKSQGPTTTHLQKVPQSAPRHQYTQFQRIGISLTSIPYQQKIAFHPIEERPHATNMSVITNGHTSDVERIANHTEEKHLPGGWVVLKFGGTSVGKFAENIAGIVK